MIMHHLEMSFSDIRLKYFHIGDGQGSEADSCCAKLLYFMPLYMYYHFNVDQLSSGGWGKRINESNLI